MHESEHDLRRRRQIFGSLVHIPLVSANRSALTVSRELVLGLFDYFDLFFRELLMPHFFGYFRVHVVRHCVL